MGRASGCALLWAILCAGPAAGQGLTLDHKPVRCVVAEKFPVLDARLEPAAAVRQARVTFRPAGGKRWYSVDMKPEGGLYRGTLPRPLKSLHRFQYYIEATGAAFDTPRTAEIETVVVSGTAACKDGLVAAAVATASVSIILPQATSGAPLVPAGFSSNGVVAAGGGAASGGGSSVGKVLLIMTGLVGAGAATAYYVLKPAAWENASFEGTDSEGALIQLQTGKGIIESFGYFQTSGAVTCSPTAGFQGAAAVTDDAFRFSVENSSGTFDVTGRFDGSAASGQIVFTQRPGFSCPPPFGNPPNRTLTWSASKQ